MARKKGTPAYPNKSKAGSYWITKVAFIKMRQASRRTGKSDSDIIEHCLRLQADGITRETFAVEAQP